MKGMKRESRYVQVARRAYAVSQAVLPLYSHRNSPKTYTLPQLAACVILKFYLNIPYRDMEEWLLASDTVCTVVDLKNVPDHCTLARTFRRLDKKWLDEMQRQLLADEKLSEEYIAGDSTSFSLSQASSYYRTRSGKRFNDWIKGAYAVGTHSQLIVGSSSRAGRLPDFVFLRRLKRQARHYGLYKGRQRHWYFLGDKGFDAKEITDLDLVPPIRRYGKITDPKRQERADLVSQARLDGIYGQRWKVETVNSVIKRKFGGTIRSRIWFLQRREAIIKGLVYNIHRLVTLFLFSFYRTLQQSSR
jgi:IS5 family transposase